jgi:hypothetical protein
MLGVYPGGGSQYQAHVDSSKSDLAGFYVSTLYYLNANWTAREDGRGDGGERAGGEAGTPKSAAETAAETAANADATRPHYWPGGSLRVQLLDSGDSMDITPIADRLVLMLSRTVLHQVLPCWKHRYALVSWMRVPMSGAVARDLHDTNLILAGDGAASREELRGVAFPPGGAG